MIRSSAKIDYLTEYESIVDEIRKISLKKLSINVKTKIGIILLRKCEAIFYFLHSS